MIPVMEIFGPTIQGEGPHVGMKTLFLRVAGCDFHCEWCDSKFAWEVPNATSYTEEGLAQKLIQQCQQTNTSNVVITGGNPCIYNLTEVIAALHAKDITVDIETQGSLLPDWLLTVDQIVISPKGPSSGQRDVFNQLTEWLNNVPQDLPVCIKIPVFNEDDFQFALRYYDIVSLLRHKGHKIDLYLSVGNEDVSEEGSIAPRILMAYEKLIERVSQSEMRRVFILPQVHTLVWGNRQGV